MDALDREILNALQEDARISYRDLGRRVGLSANAAADRVRKLRRSGVIRGFTTLIDRTAQDRQGLLVFIDVRLRTDIMDEQFEQAVVRLPNVIEVLALAGEYDFMIRARVADASGLDPLLRALKHTAGVAHTSTRLVLKIILD
jgi:Lrp/AsnC family leucine-responsive transcriptional regulator